VTTARARGAETLLILGGAGMVGVQVAREAVRELRPRTIVISALTQREVDEALASLQPDVGETILIGAAGDIFVPESLQGQDRARIVAEGGELYDRMFDEIFSPDPESYKGSALFQLIERHKPDVVVDCINTATAISYQDAFTVSRRTKLLLDAVERRDGAIDAAELAPLLASVRELLIAQGIPQITRHILFLHRALDASSVRVYVKVGTTGTGGMGINIPYTHSEDKPSPQLLSKSAIGFAHTGLLFLLARTPGSRRPEPSDRERDDHPGHSNGQAAIIKEIKPGAMIGFKRLGETHVKIAGASGRREPGYLLNAHDETLGAALQTREPFDGYGRFDDTDVPIRIVAADTGENGIFSLGEFQAITYPRQMEYVTPEEVARTAILEILGASTGRDVLSAIDGAITEPSYRAGVLRAQAIREMERLETLLAGEVLPSIAIGHLGPPKLSKLLIEAYLLRAAAGTADIGALLALEAAALKTRVDDWLAAHPRIVSLITTIGIPLLRSDDTLTRGPRINIPPAPPDGAAVPLGPEAVEAYAQNGWVDLRLANFESWRARLRKLSTSRPDIVTHGSAAFELASYPGETFSPGDVVGWLLTTEIDAQGMVGHRLF
jgi:hypothetical protein